MSYAESDQIQKNSNCDPFVEDRKGSISKRLIELAKGRTIRETAKIWDVSTATVNLYLKKGGMPALDKAVSIANAEGVSINWLVSGEDKKRTPPPAVANDNIVEIFQYDFKASAGAGCLVVSENPVAKFELSKEWLTKQGLSGKQLTVVPVYGDSMETTLMDEDLMLVELIEDVKQARDGICVFRIDDEVMVKRLQYDFVNRRYKVTSDNSAYDPFYIGEEFEGRFQIFGRMVRVLQRAKR
ncbi:XRE family transcriptional regulator [Vibrio parahaemolyticus]|uniref:XRE family transcriptional regulator n=1 Tax=Vibrio parahaemolyticus TaxID=670 RepID=UPI003892A1D7